jgi:hypothetical protein
MCEAAKVQKDCRAMEKREKIYVHHDRLFPNSFRFTEQVGVVITLQARIGRCLGLISVVLSIMLTEVFGYFPQCPQANFGVVL